MIRIIAGHYRSRRLASPPDDRTTRPWGQRAKESVFNVLRGHIEDANVLDLFAGVGTMGLEAVSRGARRVLMVERDPRIFSLLESNVETLDCRGQADLLRGDALGSVSILRAPRPLQVAFVDPPYAMMRQVEMRQRVLDHVARLSDILDSNGLIVLRTPEDPRHTSHEIGPFEGPEVRSAGKGQWVLLYSPGRVAP